MEIAHKDSKNGGLFYIEMAGETRAQLYYSGPEDNAVIATHTEVDDELRHQNTGTEMVAALVQYARQHQLKIVPACPFVASVFAKKPEYSDVWQKN